MSSPRTPVDNPVLDTGTSTYGAQMLLQISLIDSRDGSERALEVRAGEQHTLADLLSALDLQAGSPATAPPVWVDGAPLDPESTIGSPPLLDGASLVLGDSGRAPIGATQGSPLRLTTTTGPDAGLSLQLTPGRQVLGRGDTASLRVADSSLSREHFSLSVDRDGVLIHDLDTTNGTRVDGAPIPVSGARVRAGSQIHAGHTTFALEARRSRPSRRQARGDGTLAVNPTPHLPAAPGSITITLPTEPRPPAKRRIPWVMVLLPLPFAALLAVFFGPRMLLFGLLSPILALASTLSDRTSSRSDYRQEHAEWVRERARSAHRLTEALAAERRQRALTAPDAMALLDAARGDSHRLWERRPHHEAFLHLRLGLGDQPAQITVDRREREDRAEREHPVLQDVPLVVDLTEVGVLGVIGTPTERVGLARHLLGQILTWHSHHDVRLSVVATGEGWWSPFASLVHLREHHDIPGSSRIASEPEQAMALFADLAQVARERATAPAGPAGTRTCSPVHVLIVDDIHRWRADANLRAVLADGAAHQVLVIAVSASADELPHECGAIVAIAGDQVRLHIAGSTAAEGIVDGVGSAWSRRLAAALAPLRDATPDPTGAGLPTAARLVDLLEVDPDDADAIQAAWRHGTQPVDCAVVVGQGADGEFRIDLRRDGPHALVAGTTGSGKSEFLQSWVCALAAKLSPQEITFVLVDYKGGAAFAECARLPHTVGLLTDLAPDQAERALTSLDAELTRRERILADAGVSNIDDHRGEPLPRLMIVIDEFRMLAEEQPEALSHLMKIAAVGRSLGVHLVLATQRPGGIVSADIKANVNLRIALRVRDRIDSDDVLGTGDAVSIPEEAPGRAMARTGGSPPRTFQTGRVAGHAAPQDEGVLVRSAGGAWPAPSSPATTGASDLQRLAVTMARCAQAMDLAPPHRPWLPPLPSRVTAPDLAPPAAEGGAPFALVDRPERQEQTPLSWSPAEGHWMVVGGPGTGRTTTLASIITAAARRWSPAEVQAQIVGDGSAAITSLATLPHVGSVIDGDDLAVFGRFLTRLNAELTERRSQLRASGHSTVDAWWAAYRLDPAHIATPPPHLLLALDGRGRVTRPLGDADLGESAQQLEMLLRDGISAGLRAVITGGREMLSGRISSLISSRIVLHLPDRGDATLAGLKPSEIATEIIPGRARQQPGGHLLQVALLDQNDPSRTVSTQPQSEHRPWVVEALPQVAKISSLPRPDREHLPLGMGGWGRDPVIWRTGGARKALICGPPRSGRTTALLTVARQAHAAGYPVALLGIDTADHPALSRCPVVDPEDRDKLIDLRRQHPDLAVLIDDADRIEDAPVTDVLREIARRVDSDGGLVIAATSTQAALHQIRGLIADIGRGRTGLLLQPAVRSDGDAFGMRVPPLPKVPGRGYFITSGEAHEIQVGCGS